MKNKLLSIVAMATTLFLAFSLTSIVNAAGTTVENITNEDTIASGTVSPKIETSDSETTLTYSAIDLKVVPGNPAIQRPAGYAWIGVKATAPNDLDITKYQIGSDAEVSKTTYEEYSYPEEYLGNVKNQSSFTYATSYTFDAKEGKDVLYTVTVKWMNSSSEVKATHTINVVVKVDSITLKDETGSKELWNEAKYEEVVKEVEAKKAAEAKKEEKDTTYKTGSSVAAIALISAMVSIAGIAIIKR